MPLITCSPFETEPTSPWTLDLATYSRSSTINFNMTGIKFKSDGLKAIVTRDSTAVYNFTFGTAWNAATANAGSTFNTGGTRSQDVYVKPDGTMMWIADDQTDKVYEFFMATPWDVTTAYAGSPAVAEAITNVYGLDFKPDGTVMYVARFAGTQYIEQYDLSVAWDITTKSANGSKTTGTFTTGVKLKDDGTKLFYTDITNHLVQEMNLSVAWDVTSASNVQTFVTSAFENSPEGLDFKPDGKRLYVVGSQGDDIHEINL